MTSSTASLAGQCVAPEPLTLTARRTRALEMLALFVGIPLLLTLLAGRVNPLPVLAVILVIVAVRRAGEAA